MAELIQIGFRWMSDRYNLSVIMRVLITALEDSCLPMRQAKELADNVFIGGDISFVW